MLSKRFLITLALYCFSLDTTSSKKFTDGVPACKRDNPKLDECLLNILKHAKPQLMRGNLELNLPSLDPVTIPKLSLRRTMQDIKVNGDLTSLTAKGANSITAKSFKVKLDEKTWDMVVDIPLITFVTDFNLNATLKNLHVPVFGKGQCEGSISRSSIIFHANTEINDDKLKLEDIKINLRLGDVDVHIIKSQNPALATTASQFFNANKRLVLDLVTPIAEEAARDLLLRHGNRILSTVLITDMLVD